MGSTSSIRRPTSGAGLRVRAEQALGGGVADDDDAWLVDADDAGRHPGEAASMKARRSSLSSVGRDQAFALLAQFPRHLVEGLAEMAEIALGFAGRHPHREIAGGDLVGGANQAADRADELVGESEAGPHRRDQQGQRQHDEHAGEAELDIAPMGLEIGERGGHIRRVARHPVRDRIDRAAGIEERARPSRRSAAAR